MLPGLHADQHLQRVRRGMAVHAGQAHLVWPLLLKRYLRQVQHHVGRDVAGRVVHLVQQLLGDRVAVDAPPATWRLGDADRKVTCHLGNREANPVQARHVLYARVGKVSARRLSAAFEQVPGHDAAGQFVRCGPAEMRLQRAKRQGRVCHAPGDDHVRARPAGTGDGRRTQIGVGGHDWGAEAGGGFARFHQYRVPVAHKPGDIVAQHGRHHHATQPGLGRHAMRHRRRRPGRRSAPIADQPRAMPVTGRQQHRQTTCQGREITGLPLRPARLQHRQRAFRQGLDHEHVDAPVLH